MADGDDDKRKLRDRINNPAEYDFYKLLDVPRIANNEAIIRAQRKTCLKVHPDKNGQDAGEKELFTKATARVNEMCGVLKDEAKRQHYDRKLDVLDQVGLLSADEPTCRTGLVGCLVGALASKMLAKVGVRSTA